MKLSEKSIGTVPVIVPVTEKNTRYFQRLNSVRATITEKGGHPRFYRRVFAQMTFSTFHITITRLLPFVLLFHLSGCAFVDQLSGTLTVSPPQEREPVAVAQDGLSEDVPFRLEILDELNDGEKLIVRGRAIAKTSWELTKAVVRLTGLTEDGEVRNSLFPLSSSPVNQVSGVPIEARASLKSTLAPGEKVDFSLELPAKGLSSYQLELLWGSDAEPVLKMAAVPKGPAFLALRKLEVTLRRSLTCDFIPCPSTYQLTGELYNSGGATVTDVVLGAGFILTEDQGKLALSDQIPENEQRIEVRNIRLAPGEAKAVKVVLDQPILESEGRIKPVIRIVSFETEL